MIKADDLYTLIWMSRPLMQAAETLAEQGLAGTGLTVRTRAVLEILHKHGDASVPQIADRLDIKRQYVQLMINDTLAEGLTEQRPNSRHKRSSLIALTPRGAELIERVIAREHATVEALGEPFDTADIATALDVIQRVTSALKNRSREQQ